MLTRKRSVILASFGSFFVIALQLQLTGAEKSDLEQFLLSLGGEAK